MTAKRLNLDFVTGLRALAALYVLLSHAWYEIWPAVPPPYGYATRPSGLVATLTNWLYYGHFGVVIFIVISGFCLMLPVAAHNGFIKGGVASYLRRRATRIAPPYYFAMAGSLLAISLLIGDMTGAQWDIALPVTPSAVLSHVLFLQDFVDSTRVNYVFWSIAIEAQLYLIFPLLVLMMRVLGAPRTLVAVAVTVYGAILILEMFEYTDVPPQFIGLCAYFAFGAAAAKLVVQRPDFVWRANDRLLAAGAAALLITVALLAANWGFDAAERRFAALDTLVALATVLVLLAASSHETQIIRRVLERPSLLTIGTFSYSLYLVHAPVLHAVWLCLLRPLGVAPEGQFVGLLAFGVPVSLLTAYVFFLACERPFMSPTDLQVFRFASFKSQTIMKRGPFARIKSTLSNRSEMTVSLARKSLLYDWRRYLAGVLAVAFSGLLVIVQLALLLGLLHTVTAVVDHSKADLWVTEATTQSFDLPRDMPERFEMRLRGYAGVERVEPLQLSISEWRAPNGQKVSLLLVGVDCSENSLGFPRPLPVEFRDMLRQPGSVIVDQSDLRKLGLESADERVTEINGRKMQVVAVANGFRYLGLAIAFVSLDTYRETRLDQGSGGANGVSYYLLTLQQGAERDAVRAAMQNDDTTHVLTPGEFSSQSHIYWLLETGTGAGILFSTMLGLLVGISITGQTMRAAVLSSLREYATLRALGIPLSALRAVVIEQSFWIGAAGLVITFVVAKIVFWIAAMAQVAIAVTWWATLGAAVLMLVVSLLSGFLAIGPLLKSEPAGLLR
jgi:putative ABC transport system permease protein